MRIAAYLALAAAQVHEFASEAIPEQHSLKIAAIFHVFGGRNNSEERAFVSVHALALSMSGVMME